MRKTRMEVMSRIYDKRINSTNLYVTTTFKEYLSIAGYLIKNNELQRKRVKTSKTVYSLLKTDLINGCVMPPIVLAITNNDEISNKNTDEEIFEYIKKNSKNVLILDGLQRTYTLIDAGNEISDDKREEFLNYEMRLEIYIDMNKFGVLYRMLTLNTGQTPMSPRHQLEMLYSGMLDTEVEGIKLVREVEGKSNPDDNEFIFKNVIEGFNSYMNRNELPMDREDILENVRILENMANENIKEDLFKEFLEMYVKLFKALRSVSGDYIVKKEDLEEYEIISTPFGNKVSKVFSTSQAMTGFGAAFGIMKDKGIFKKEKNDFVFLKGIIDNIDRANSGNEWLMMFLKKMDIIKNNSKKIGNGQRMFFHYFYRELLNPESDSFLKLDLAVENGYKKYDSQVN